MAKWLKGLTMAEAAKNPGNHHAETLSHNNMIDDPISKEFC